MGFLRLFLAHPYLIAFGVLSNACSSFGQTFFLSLFTPSLTEHFGLSMVELGSYYAGVTLLSAILLSITGGWIDTVDARVFCFGVAVTLSGSALLLGFAEHLPLMLLGLFGVRFGGQGLFSHLAGTIISRSFSSKRGKALSLSSVGFPLGEAILPFVVVQVLMMVHWTTLWQIVGIGVFVLYVPVAVLLLTKAKPEEEHRTPSSAKVEAVSHAKPIWTRKDVFQHPMVWMLLPYTVISPFLLTGLFFHQATISNDFQFEPSVMAGAFVFFGLARGGSALCIGPLIDRYRAIRLLPFTLIPIGLGTLFMGLWTEPLTASIYLGLAGMSVGLSGPVRAAFYAETFGTVHLGAIRSVFTTLAVFATALSPPSMGYFLEHVGDSSTLFYSCAASVFVASMMAWFAAGRLGADEQPPKSA